MFSDAELIRQVRQGKRQSFGILIERYERLVRATALRMIRDRHAAEDTTQEAFVQALEQLDSLREPAKSCAWLITITKRTASKSVRRHKYAPALVGDADSFISSTVDGLSPESEHLMELVERLPEHEQTAILLRYLNGHSAQEIADITGRSVGTVTKQLSRAYDRLREWIRREI